jgi:hypothetical protein
MINIYKIIVIIVIKHIFIYKIQNLIYSIVRNKKKVKIISKHLLNFFDQSFGAQKFL